MNLVPLAACASLVLLSACGTDVPEPAPSPDPAAVLHVQTGGRQAELDQPLPREVKAHAFVVRCSGTGEVEFSAQLAGHERFEGTLACPGQMTSGTVDAWRRTITTMSIKATKGSPNGLLELVQPGS